MSQTPDEYLNFLSKLSKENIDYWLDFGSALWAYRNDYIPSNEDLDIGVWGTEATLVLLHKIVINNFENICVEEDIWKNNCMRYKITFSTNSDLQVDIRIYRKYKQYAWTVLFERRALLKGEKKKVGERLTNLLYRNFKNLVGRDFWLWRHNYLAGIFLIPRQFFENNFKKEISGYEISLPAQPENFLKLHYGVDWQKPDDEWQFLSDDGTFLEVNYEMIQRMMEA